jgi:hypothetical protein
MCLYIKQDSGIQLAAGNERIVGPYYFHSVYLRLIGPVLKNKVRPVIFTRCGTGPTKRTWPISKIFLTTLDWMTWILSSTHFPVNIYESIFAPLCLFLRVPISGQCATPAPPTSSPPMASVASIASHRPNGRGVFPAVGPTVVPTSSISGASSLPRTIHTSNLGHRHHRQQ